MNYFRAQNYAKQGYSARRISDLCGIPIKAARRIKARASAPPQTLPQNVEAKAPPAPAPDVTRRDRFRKERLLRMKAPPPLCSDDWWLWNDMRFRRVMERENLERPSSIKLARRAGYGRAGMVS